MLTLFDTDYAQLILCALDHTAGVIIIDSHKNTLLFNNKFIEISQYDKNKKNDLIDNITQLINSDEIWHGELCYNKNSGIPSWVDLTIVPHFNKAKNTTYYISICFDISTQKMTEEHLRANKNMLQKALTIDPLTGISNRIAFSNHVKSIPKKEKSNLLVCIYMIDIDSFKIANDTLGHKAGDKLLKEISQKLHNAQNDHTLVARMGGDEFAIITTGSSENYFKEKVNRTIQSLNFLFSFNGIVHHTTASIGYAISNINDKDIYNTLYSADIALYHAKSMGGNCAYAYNSELKHQHDNKIRLRSAILNNLQKNEFLIQYQPIIEMNSNNIVSTSTSLQCLSPHGDWSIDNLDNIVDNIHIDRALSQTSFTEILKEIQKIQKYPINFSLKIPSKNIIHAQLLSNTIEKITKHSIPPERVILEIDNNIINNTKNNAIQRDLAELRKMGIKIILSGFGKEKTYLMPLRDIEYDYTKIDFSLIQTLHSSTINRTITKSLIDITHAMGKKTIAEGVETTQCADILTQLGCDFAQGLFYSPPLTLKQLEKKLQTSTSPFR
ncbi:EAL domain-containing protein [Neokomagataea anthophila]|uniref:EAL domain-containing protein n=1 Tax=Neokomagataea anthophila TaxID=2826925 RepID=A0ABS5E7F9_9PROT|nr:EAL domain-containing protein [Neokomagataea anthophila]MBR0559850.1 EAL domain-containing protein [Neokomagataea anthophila]